jgi:prepilin-type N-terminal cleavage/methylation domain-containing protein
MKINKTKTFSSAFTLIELLVVIAIIAILASIALPVFSSVQERSKQTKDLSNGKQIALALKQFATDSNGEFPNKVYSTCAGDYAGCANLLIAASPSNEALRWLLPVYLRSEDVFVVPGSAWNPTGANNILDAVYGTPVAGGTLAAGENGYSYITALNDTSDPSFPLVADGWKPGGITYDNVKSAQGGVWGGQKAIVIFVDGSGQVMKCNNQAVPNATFPTRPGRAYNIFSNTSSVPADPWLTAANLQLLPQ